jgi:hypothetical protein
MNKKNSSYIDWFQSSFLDGIENGKNLSLSLKSSITSDHIGPIAPLVCAFGLCSFFINIPFYFSK